MIERIYTVRKKEIVQNLSFTLNDWETHPKAMQ